MQPLLLTLAALAPLQQPVQGGYEAERLAAPKLTAECADPRTPIDAKHTPGDADSVYRITKPGSYYLTRNLKGRDGAFGIEVAASDVTIDLMGFKMTGTPASNDGIATLGTQSRVSVRNGTIVGWGVMGIDFVSGYGCRVEDVTASDNGYVGIWIGHQGELVRCIGRRNGDTGLRATTRSRVEGCVANDNAGSGIRANTQSIVSGSVAVGNGLRGIYLGGNGMVIASTAHENQGDGISAGPRSQVTDCAANENLGVGISGFTGVRIEGCEASLNVEAGIRVWNMSRVVGNVCEENGAPGAGAGILVTGWQNVLEDNLCVNGKYAGFQIEGSRNLARRNAAGDNFVNWAVFAGNYAKVMAAAPTPGFLGDAGGVAPGPSDPNVNYTL